MIIIITTIIIIIKHPNPLKGGLKALDNQKPEQRENARVTWGFVFLHVRSVLTKQVQISESATAATYNWCARFSGSVQILCLSRAKPTSQWPKSTTWNKFKYVSLGQLYVFGSSKECLLFTSLGFKEEEKRQKEKTFFTLPQLSNNGGGFGGDSSFFLVCEDFGRMFDNSFPACACFFFFWWD